MKPKERPKQTADAFLNVFDYFVPTLQSYVAV